jgi:SARP family transcriptional regulator, regulator of embCAB operon
MDIVLLGPLAVRMGTRLLGPGDFGGVKPREVFELLAMARGRPVSKERLADELWGDDQPVNAMAALETYVSVLRRHLSADRAEARALVRTHRGSYQLGGDSLTIDADRFDELTDAAASAPAGQRLALLQEAVALVEGELLASSLYAPWAEAERERYHRRVVQARLGLAEEAVAHSLAGEALEQACSVLAADPYDERAHRLAIVAAHTLGRPGLVRELADRCRTVLRDELGCEPAGDTMDVLTAVESGAGRMEILDAIGVVPVVIDLSNSPDLAPSTLGARQPFWSSMAGALHAWVDEIGGLAPSLLPVAAVLGPTIDYRHLSRLVDERCWDVAAELHRCCTLGILVERPGGWTFAHPAVGHALAAAVPAEERRRLRQASARAAATLVPLVSAAA